MVCKLCFVLLITAAALGVAQSPVETFALRLQGGANLSAHSANFTSNGDIVDCGNLTSGTGINPVVQAILEFPITSNLGIGVGVGYVGRSASITHQEAYPIRNGTTGSDETLITDLALDATLTYLEIQPDLRLPLIGSYQQRTLGIFGGPRIALPITTKFVQHETVVSPENATFIVDGKRTQDRTIASGPLSTRSAMLLGASIGIESAIPLSATTSLVPAVSADYFFTGVVHDAPWRTYGLRAELGLRFSFVKQTQPPTQQPPPPPPAIIAFAPVTVAISNPAFDGEVVTGDLLNASTPVVNAVFFDSASAQIPSRYKTVDDGSAPPSDAVEAHYWILRHVSSVVARNPEAVVRLEGAGGNSIGRDRAEAVAAALVGLGIPQGRITSASRDLPRMPSNNDFAGGRQENQRVDIILQNAPLQEWVTATKFAELHGTIRGTVTRYGGDPELQQNAVIRTYVQNHDSSVVMVRTATGLFSLPLTESVSSAADTITIPVLAECNGAATRLDVAVNLPSLPHRSINLETKNFEAVLRFDYNSDELTPEVQQLLRQLVDKLPRGSTITVAGSSDALGSADRNKILENNRAQNTVAFIKNLVGSALSVATVTSDKHFSDATPQGRFLNRSIRIFASTP